MSQPPQDEIDPKDAAARRRALRILGLVSAGQGLSSFYLLCLPPLIPYLKGEFGVSYAALGLMLSVRSMVTGALQLPMGYLVDRFGAKPLMTGGLALIAIGFGLIAFVPGYWWILILSVVIGIGQSTLRPSSYTIISASMPRAWMGRSFATNVFAGHTGRAIAPAVIIGLASWLDWRGAVLAAGAGGLVIAVIVITQWRVVRDDTRPERGAEQGESGSLAAQLRLFASRTILLFFCFYTLTSLTTSGIQSFVVVGLVKLHDTPIATASSALTGYLIASAAGVLMGGIVADRTSRHELVAALALLCSAALVIALGIVSLPGAAIVALLTVVGMFQGTVRPARDMLVRALLPRESFGKAIGMVSTGAAIGGGTAPVVFGWIMDIGEPQWLFYVIGGCIALLALTISWPKEKLGG